jgi:hypothetical protein
MSSFVSFGFFLEFSFPLDSFLSSFSSPVCLFSSQSLPGFVVFLSLFCSSSSSSPAFFPPSDLRSGGVDLLGKKGLGRDFGQGFLFCSVDVTTAFVSGECERFSLGWNRNRMEWDRRGCDTQPNHAEPFFVTAVWVFFDFMVVGQVCWLLSSFLSVPVFWVSDPLFLFLFLSFFSLFPGPSLLACFALPFESFR